MLVFLKLNIPSKIPSKNFAALLFAPPPKFAGRKQGQAAHTTAAIQNGATAQDNPLPA
jgi:hypothetical protein